VISPDRFQGRRGDLWRYQEIIPVPADERVTLGEGGTPLIDCEELADWFDLNNLYLKDESQNPTWSFKDRLASVAVSKAVESGAQVVTISSTGNHGAATAAYASRAGLESVIFTKESVPETMKRLMQIYGANVVALETSEGRWTLMKQCVEEYGWYPTGNYVSPPVGSNFYGVEGYKTIAYEICEELDWSVPDVIVQPTAYADGLLGIWRGFTEMERLGLVEEVPRMISAELFGPLKRTLETGTDEPRTVDTGTSIAFSIGVGVSTYQGLIALRESDGMSVLTDDNEVRELQRLTSRTTGIYGEASAIAAVAAVKTLHEDNEIDADDTIVMINTSTGLKDTETTADTLPTVPSVDPDLDDLHMTLKEHYGFDDW
jgi:threonine synthase